MLKTLTKGDEVLITSPSTYKENKNNFLEGIEILESWGLSIIHNDLLSKKYGYLAGSDATRFKDLMEAENYKLMIFSNGGWGSARLLELSPKWVDSWMLGFSDTCSLLLSKYANGCMGSIHGPMVSNLSKEPEWSINRLKNLLFDGYVEDLEGKTIKKGVAQGEIVVSNLTIASFLIGTNHFPDVNGKIIIFEDINEELYKIDRMLTYWRLSKKLANVAGIGFGSFNAKTTNLEEKQIFEELIYESFKEYNIPIISNLPIGHISGNACIPYGFQAMLDGNKGTLRVHVNLD